MGEIRQGVGMGECGIGNEERKGRVHNDHHHTFSKTFTMHVRGK